MIYLWLEKKIGAGNAVFAVFVLLMLLMWAATSAWSGISKRYWKHEATTATAAAVIAQGNADSANAGATNATLTRQQMDGQTITFRVLTEDRAARIESHANPDPIAADRQPPDPAIVRELEAAEHQARAASDRLQRARAR